MASVDLDTPEHALCSDTMAGLKADLAYVRKQRDDAMVRSAKLGDELNTQARNHAKRWKRLADNYQAERENSQHFRRALVEVRRYLAVNPLDFALPIKVIDEALSGEQHKSATPEEK